MGNPTYKRGYQGYGPYEGPRVCEWGDFESLDENDLIKIELIWEALEWCELVSFNYSGYDRVVAPFVLGASQEGRILMRGYQTQGASKSEKVGGWRVFKIKEMGSLQKFGEYFFKEQYDFQEYYPWIYRVFKML